MTAGHRYNPPPGWPPMPAGWSPPPGWTKPADWPEPPPGWQFWTPGPAQKQKGWPGRHPVLLTFLVIFGVLMLIGIIAAAGSSTPATTAAPGSDESSAAPKATPTKAKPKAKSQARIGQPARDGKFQFTVTRVQPGVAQVGSADFGKKAQGQFVFVHVTVTNVGNEARTFDGSSQYAYDKVGRKYEASTEAAIYLDDSQSFLEEINPGNTVKGIVIFDMPKGTIPTVLELHDSAFSGGAKVSLT